MSHGLKLEGVGFAYDATPVLQDINVSIPEGQLVSLLGASGSGKTTLLRLAAGLNPVDSGRLTWNGVPVVGPSLERGVVFQESLLQNSPGASCCAAAFALRERFLLRAKPVRLSG